MKYPKSIFRGNVHVYLQGHRALLPVQLPGINDEMSYYIGGQETRLVVKDHRKISNGAARQVLSGNQDIKFSQHFNKPALVEIRKTRDQITIDMQETNLEENERTLWLGVIHNEKMPVQKIFWQVLEPVGETSVAFAALVEN